jgi:hypothetical protein
MHARPPTGANSPRATQQPRGFLFLLRSHRRATSDGAKRRLHLVGRPEPTLTVVLRAVRQPRAIQCQAADGKARRREELFLLSDLTNCPKTQSADIYDRCKAKYEGLTTR